VGEKAASCRKRVKFFRFLEISLCSLSSVVIQWVLKPVGWVVVLLIDSEVLVRGTRGINGRSNRTIPAPHLFDSGGFSLLVDSGFPLLVRGS
jgi:hypothetical protein